MSQGHASNDQASCAICNEPPVALVATDEGALCIFYSSTEPDTVTGCQGGQMLLSCMWLPPLPGEYDTKAGTSEKGEIRVSSDTAVRCAAELDLHAGVWRLGREVLLLCI